MGWASSSYCVVSNEHRMKARKKWPKSVGRSPLCDSATMMKVRRSCTLSEYTSCAIDRGANATTTTITRSPACRAVRSVHRRRSSSFVVVVRRRRSSSFLRRRSFVVPSSFVVVVRRRSFVVVCRRRSSSLVVVRCCLSLFVVVRFDDCVCVALCC